MIGTRTVSPEEGNSMKWLRREWAWEELPFNLHSRCCLRCKCHGWRTERGVCVRAASLALREAPFHLAKLPCCCRLTPKQLMCLLHKRLWFEMLKTAILCVLMCVKGWRLNGQWSPPAEGGGCQMEIAYCDFTDAFWEDRYHLLR